MKKKVFTVLSVFYLSQMMFSCCDCVAETFEIQYNDVTIVPYDTSGFNNEIAVDNVFKNAFGLGISVGSETTKIANRTKTISQFGFSAAMAMTCDCIEDMIYSDPISHIIIYVIDTETNEKTDVTSSFGIYSYDSNELIALDQFFDQRENWHDGFQFELVEYDSMPDSVIFIAEVYLESGITFSDQTDNINFSE